MNASYSIPETAKLTGIPEHAIREYAKQFADVLPSPEQNESGRATVKRYPDAALSIFRSIRKLKDEGMDTADIRTALQSPAGTDGYNDWDNIALQTAAGTALNAEGESETEWKEESVEAGMEATPAETTHEEYHEAVAEEWTAPASEHTAGTEATCDAVTEYTEESVYTEAQADVATEELTLALDATEEETAHEATAAVTEVSEIGATFHPLFTNLGDGLLQLRQIMDENTLERESLRSERETLLTETALKSDEISHLKATVASQEEKIGGLQGALGVLMGQCDQQLQAIRSALGEN